MWAVLSIYVLLLPVIAAIAVVLVRDHASNSGALPRTVLSHSQCPRLTCLARRNYSPYWTVFSSSGPGPALKSPLEGSFFPNPRQRYDGPADRGFRGVLLEF